MTNIIVPGDRSIRTIHRGRQFRTDEVVFSVRSMPPRDVSFKEWAEVCGFTDRDRGVAVYYRGVQLNKDGTPSGHKRTLQEYGYATPSELEAILQRAPVVFAEARTRAEAKYRAMLRTVEEDEAWLQGYLAALRTPVRS